MCYEEQRSVVRFLWPKGLNVKDIYKEIFPVYSWKCLSRKAVHNVVDKFSQWWRRWSGGAEVAETTVKRLMRFGFRRTGKAMVQVYQCWWAICRGINVFSSSKYNMFFVIYQFVKYLLTLARTCLNITVLSCRTSWCLRNSLYLYSSGTWYEYRLRYPLS
jgi:hypothetical protein